MADPPGTIEPAVGMVEHWRVPEAFMVGEGREVGPVPRPLQADVLAAAYDLAPWQVKTYLVGNDPTKRLLAPRIIKKNYSLLPPSHFTDPLTKSLSYDINVFHFSGMKNSSALQNEFEIIELDESQLHGVQAGIGPIGVGVAVFIGTTLGAIAAHRKAVNKLKPCKA